MENHQEYFYRLIPDGGWLSRDSERVYPPEVYQFGNAEMQFFMYDHGDGYNVVERTTGLHIGYGEDMDSAQKSTYDAIDTLGGQKEFIELIKDTLQKLGQGLKYNFEREAWVDPLKEATNGNIKSS